MIDAKKEIRRAVDTGKVIFGMKQSEKSILKGKGELIIISSNANDLVKERLEEIGRISEIPSYGFDGTALELGSVCGKPFPVSVMVVLSKGKSQAAELKEKKEKKRTKAKGKR